VATYSTIGVTTINGTVMTSDVWKQWTNATVQFQQALQTATATTGTTIRYWQDMQREGVWTQWSGTGQPTFTPNEELYRDWVLADEDRDARWAREAERQRVFEEMRADREQLRREQLRQLTEAAQERAMELFLGLLSDEQRATWAEAQHVDVRGSEGGLYRIEGGMGSVHGNVVVIDEHGCYLTRLCFAPQMWEDGEVLPIGDVFVGQMMAIQHDELAVRRIANPSNRRPCRQQVREVA
jgi:hypothetical protein